MAQEVDANKDLFSFWAFDEASAIPGEFITNINVMNNKSIFSLKKVMEATNEETLSFLDEMGIEASIISQGIVSLGNHDSVAKTVLSQKVMDFSIRTVQYLLKQKNIVWALTFTTDENDYSDNNSSLTR